MSVRNFYEILKSTPAASFEELRRNYKQLILQCHPDKLQHDNTNTGETTATATTTSSNFDNITSQTNDVASTVTATVDPNAEIPTVKPLDERCSEFVAINKAWSTLKDPTKRRLYDAELMLTKFQAHSNIFARLTLADMKRCAVTKVTANSGSDSDCDVGAYEAEGASEGQSAEGGTYWYYTYECRCGGQYIVDESAYSEILRGNHNSTASDQRHSQSPQGEQKAQEKQMSHHHDNVIDKPSSQAAADSGVANASAPICGSNRNSETTGDDDDVMGAADDCADDGDDGEVLVECSECSLVIVLT